jgi:V-type H+-transporting ATPase subunit C
LANFKWNEAQYPVSKPLKQLIQSITESVTKGEENIRTRLSDYNDIKSKLAGVKKKSSGSLAVKPIAHMVKSFYQQHNEEGPVESEYLTTLFVAIPMQQEKQWLKDYVSMGDTKFVVPDSSSLICRESDYCLYNVIIFKKVAESYKHCCRENKYVAREYNPGEEVTDAELEELNEQADTKKNNLIRWLKNTFSETYSAWIHLKAIRIFVESILKYGLPPNFVAMLFHVDAKREKDVRKQLGTMYANLRPKKYGGEDETDTVNALELQYPYISLKVRATAAE